MEFRRSLLVPYSAEDMFDLIEGAELYPQFLPWCSAAHLLERSDDWVAARLEFDYHRLRFGFQTRNPKRRPEWLQVRLVEGPFKRFHGEWNLKQLGDLGCKVSFELTYELADGWLDRIALPAVEIVSHSIITAFMRRAELTLKPCAPAAAAAEPVAAPEVPRPTPVPETLPELRVATVAPVAVAAPAPPVAVIPPAPPVQATPPATPVREVAMITTTDPTLYAAVAASRLAEGLSPEQTGVLAGLLQMQTLPAGHVLAQEGSVDNRLVVVVAGTLGVVKNLGSTEETLLVTLGAGDLAHELGFLDGAARYASLVAASEATVLMLEREKLESLIGTDPQILYRVMCAIVRTVHRIQTRLSIQATELANYVYKQHGRY